MVSRISPPSRHHGTLLLADISGYTSFLQGVDDAHREFAEADEPPIAYVIMSTLLDSIVSSIGPTFSLAKFEGDAVFAASMGHVDGAVLLEVVDRCYATFRERLGEAGVAWTCSCSACVRVGELDLKFIVHHGRWVAQAIGGREELAGPDVNLVHRLLKNHARDLVGPVPYLLITQPTVDALSIRTSDMASGDESYDDAPPVRVHVRRLS